MVAQIVSFFQRTPRFSPAPADWSQQELAEFYRVENALIRAGIRVGTDRGLSDENEPWFIFYRADDGEVVIHFARIDGEYLIAGPAYEEIARGYDFSALVRNMIARHPLVRRSHQNDNVSIHPAALLIAVVGTAFFKTGEARAAETREGPSRPALLFGSSAPVAVQAAAPQHIDSVQIPANQAVLILAAALLASDYSLESASIDAAARAAIQATAAALDFGDTPRAPLAGTHDVGSASTSHAVAPYTSASQQMSSVLSLVAVLNSMPQETHVGNEGLAPSEAALAAQPAHHGPIFNSVPAPLEDHNWAVDVRLSSGSFPTVDAVQLVRGYLGDPNYKKISVIEVTKLPDVLADLINRGNHVFTPATPATPDAPTTNPVTPDLVTPAAPDTGSGGHTDDTSVTPPAIEPKPTPQTPSFASPELVKQFIDYFISHTDHVEVMTQGSAVVFFDVRILQHSSEIVHLTSLTFDFADGSSISLVGDSPSFLNNQFLI